MMQGGPQMHTIAAKAVNFGECATPEYAGLRPQVIANAKVLAEALGSRAFARRPVAPIPICRCTTCSRCSSRVSMPKPVATRQGSR